MPMKSVFSNKLPPHQEHPSPKGVPSNTTSDGRAIRDRLKNEIEKNKSLGRELGLENLQRLHAEKALLLRERELLKETESGMLVPVRLLIVDMRQSLETLMKQKGDAERIIKRYEENSVNIKDN
jgi:hypothetical protein